MMLPILCCLLTAPVFGQANEAEKILSSLETKIEAAAAVKIVSTTDMRGDGPQGEVRTTLLFAPGNKMRCEIIMPARLNDLEFEYKVNLLSNGKQMRVNHLVRQRKEVDLGDVTVTQTEDASEEREVPQRLRELLLVSCVRLGSPSLIRIAKSNSIAKGTFAEKAIPKEVRLNPDDRIDGRLAKVISFAMFDENTMTLWLDSATSMPVRLHGKSKSTKSEYITSATMSITQ